MFFAPHLVTLTMEGVQEEQVEGNLRVCEHPHVTMKSVHLSSISQTMSPLKVSGPTTDIMFLPLLLLLITSLLLDSKHAIHMLK